MNSMQLHYVGVHSPKQGKSREKLEAKFFSLSLSALLSGATERMQSPTYDEHVFHEP